MSTLISKDQGYRNKFNELVARSQRMKNADEAVDIGHMASCLPHEYRTELITAIADANADSEGEHSDMVQGLIMGITMAGISDLFAEEGE